MTTATNFHHQHFYCFYHVVAATNIGAAYKTSNADADAYTQHYIQHRAAIQQLFPYHPFKPNHHYAMHNGALLKYWGPLASFSEFPGEQMNGKLQKMNTNYHLHMCFNYFAQKLIANTKIRGFRSYNALSDELSSMCRCFTAQ
ncbi:hypothetical protein L208DRAFT_1545387 [Tricholoma matsutake]|nr:hypothetical protein L208DRAFT_1545387 [Tricholoma matsutake 945]